MLKLSDPVKIENQAAEALRQLLEQVSAIVHVDIMGNSYTLLCEVKSAGQPRHARTALLQLRDELTRRKGEATPVFIARTFRRKSRHHVASRERVFSTSRATL